MDQRREGGRDGIGGEGDEGEEGGEGVGRVGGDLVGKGEREGAGKVKVVD